MKLLATVLLIPLWTLPALAQRLPPTNPVQPNMDIRPSPIPQYVPPREDLDAFELRRDREMDRYRHNLNRRSCRAYGTHCDDDE